LLIPLRLALFLVPAGVVAALVTYSLPGVPYLVVFSSVMSVIGLPLLYRVGLEEDVRLELRNRLFGYLRRPSGLDPKPRQAGSCTGGEAV
jgi:hypothetical protein